MKTKKKILGKVLALVKKWLTSPVSHLPVPDFNSQYDDTIL